MALTFDQKQRYSRHLTLPEVGEHGQEKLLNSKVLVIGAGGLGTPALLYLAAAGVGHIGIVDDDVVELSNLQRQVLFETTDIGRPKVEAAKDALLDLNPEIKIISVKKRLTQENISIISDYDLVLDGSDNFATRFLVNGGCVHFRKTLISGAVIGLSGVVGVYKPHAGDGLPCYQCYHPNIAQNQADASCSGSGVVGAAAGVVASTMAMEVVKEVVGFGKGLAGYILRFDMLNANVKKVKLEKNSDCPCCSKQR